MMSWLMLAVLAFFRLVEAMPTFHINLDLPPAERFHEVTARFRQDQLAILAQMKQVLKEKFAEDEVQQWVAALKAHVPEEEEFKEEIAGIAKDLAKGHASEELYDQILLFNAVYELQFTNDCSGILAADVAGTVIHGRNLDFHFLYKMPDGNEHNFPDLAFNAIFWRQGKQLLMAPSFALFNGIHTGMRFDGWSFEQNTRFTNDHKLNLEELKRGGRLFGWTVRHYMQTIPDYKTALEKMSRSHWAAPQYFIMAGAGPFEGAVIAQDRGTGKSLADTPEIQHISKEAGVWNIVQTNDDSNKKADDPRRPLAQMMLRRQHQEDVSTSFMWRDIVSPELRNDMTVFTWVGVPKTHYWFTALRNESIPTDAFEPKALNQGRGKVVGATKWARQALLQTE
mmetsp:Transcript_33739/g.69067  ORF Transcript_33739/g.69067 Transcript_33739/m.69067 type:complete len:396 (-) Transcript_33739:80-1267(-)